MKINLILDGNYLLQRNVFSLHKNNLLYGALESSLEISVNNYRQWFGFENVYFVSDSKEKSWRKQLYNEYKGNGYGTLLILFSIKYIIDNIDNSYFIKEIKTRSGNIISAICCNIS